MSEPEHPVRLPDPSFDDPANLSRVLDRCLLPLVSRPARYLGGELGAEPPEHWRSDGCNVLLCFPDAYEVGMSHTGLRILYTVLNARFDTFCDLAFAPWPDLEELMLRERLPLFGLQTRRPARQFDVIGFSLGYELGYTNVLTMLALAGVPLRTEERHDGDPLIVAGGACTMNPAVMGPFFDVLFLGDGEEVVGDMAGIVAAGRAAGSARVEILQNLRDLSGAWWPGASQPVKVQALSDLNEISLPRELVPTTEPVHDRLTIEVMRGCSRGCRFCQAGMIQRPVRERDVASVVAAATQTARTAGYSEVGLLSLSTSDYSGLGPAIAAIQASLGDSHTNLVLPSLRMDRLAPEVRAELSRERPASVTFAPEAGTQRLRDVINKQLTQPEILAGARQAVDAGVKKIKLYFMIGLPTETDEDLAGIIDLTGSLNQLAGRGGAQITVSISPFSPKAHTPFQWAGQVSRAEIHRRNRLLAEGLRPLGVKVSLREPEVSFLEAALGLGDARLADVVEAAWLDGARFDGWDEHFAWDRWLHAFRAFHLDPEAMTTPRDVEAPLPWDSIQGPVSRSFLKQEWEQALAGRTTPDCRLEQMCHSCEACGPTLNHVAADPICSGLGKQVVIDDVSLAKAPSNEHRRWHSWRERASAKIWCRMEYAKNGAAIFLGHLDFLRHMQLALRRSGLPVAYSKGYHPHPLIKFGPPLAVGVAGEREMLDLAFMEVKQDWLRRLADVMPPGIVCLRGVVMGSSTPESIDAVVERCDYEAELPPVQTGGPQTEDALEAVEKFLAAESLLWMRQRLDRPAVAVDVRGLVLTEGLSWAAQPEDGQPGVLRLSLKHDSKGGGLPMHQVLAAVFDKRLTDPRLCAVKRTGLFGRDKQGHWLSPFAMLQHERQRLWLRAHLND